VCLVELLLSLRLVAGVQDFFTASAILAPHSRHQRLRIFFQISEEHLLGADAWRKSRGTGDKKQTRGQPCNLEALRNCEEPKGHLSMPVQIDVAKELERTARNLEQESELLRDQSRDLREEAARLRKLIRKTRAERKG